MSKIRLFNIEIDNISMKEAINQIDAYIINSQNKFVVTPNVDHIMILQKNRTFFELYKKADLVLTDGMPIVLAAKILKKKTVEKVSGSDLVPELFKLASKKKYKIFILGASEGVAAEVIKKIKIELKMDIQMDCYSPPFGFEKKEFEVKKCLDKISGFAPDILLVSLGSPKGELFIYKYLDQFNSKVSIQVGAAIDFIAGVQKRAPIWMQHSGLEWFYRFVKNPRRLFKRYFIRDMKFFYLLIKELKKENRK